MPNFNSYAKLRGLSMDELVHLYDERAKTADVGVAFIREEISRREAEKQTAAISSMTMQMRNMTAWITGLTIANVVVAVITLYVTIRNAL